jgi:hypothetical protein
MFTRRSRYSQQTDPNVRSTMTCTPHSSPDSRSAAAISWTAFDVPHLPRRTQVGAALQTRVVSLAGRPLGRFSGSPARPTQGSRNNYNGEFYWSQLIDTTRVMSGFALAAKSDWPGGHPPGDTV